MTLSEQRELGTAARELSNLLLSGTHVPDPIITKYLDKMADIIKAIAPPAQTS